MTNEKITENEFSLLDEIIRNEYQPTNGSIPESFEDLGSIWLDCLESTDIHGKRKSGLISSCMKKGWVDTMEDGWDSTIWCTEAGFDAWKAFQGV